MNTNASVSDICPQKNATNDNGNLVGYTAYVGNPGASQYFGFSQTISYDKLNRLKAVSDSGGWYRSFNYDQYGNMCVSANNGPV